MKQGLNSGAISINTSSQKIINVLRNNYGFWITPGADQYSILEKGRIILGYTAAFMGAKIVGKV